MCYGAILFTLALSNQKLLIYLVQIKLIGRKEKKNEGSSNYSRSCVGAFKELKALLVPSTSMLKPTFICFKPCI
jgi:hypothetical protein